jgi:hypothetical protein
MADGKVVPSTAYKWARRAWPTSSRKRPKELRTVMVDQCDQIVQKLLPLIDETVPRDVVDSLLKVQNPQLRLMGMLQGAGITVNIGKPASGDSDEDIVVRIKADASVLWPDEPVPARPVL